MKKYAVVFERGTTSYGAYVPDLPGCIAVGKTRAVPEPSSEIEYIEPSHRYVTQKPRPNLLLPHQK